MIEKYLKNDQDDILFVENAEEGTITKINKNTNERMPLLLIDFKGYNNGDLFIFNNLLFVLYGDSLFGVNNHLRIFARYKLKEQLRKISLMDYVQSNKYVKPMTKHWHFEGYVNTFDLDDLIKYFLFAYTNYFISNEIGTDLFSGPEQFLSLMFWETQSYFDLKRESYKENDNIYIEGLDKNYIYRVIRKITKEDLQYDSYLNEIDEDRDKLNEEIERYIKSPEYIEETNKEYEEYEKFGEKYDEDFSKYIEEFGHVEEIVKRIVTNSKIRTQLIQGMSLFITFIMTNSDNTLSEDVNESFSEKDYYKDIIKNNYTNSIMYDYSFLIINFVKATEMFFAYKMSKLSGTIEIIVPENDNPERKTRKTVELSSDEFKKYAMLGDMINYLIRNNEVLNEFYNAQYKEKFINECKWFKDNCRNGYFHKDSIKTLSEATSIIMSALKLLVGIELYIK